MWGKMIILEIPSGSSLIQNHNDFFSILIFILYHLILSAYSDIIFLLTWGRDHYNRDFHRLLNTYHLTHQTENKLQQTLARYNYLGVPISPDQWLRY